jgi:hypothetical protein
MSITSTIRDLLAYGNARLTDADIARFLKYDDVLIAMVTPSRTNEFYIDEHFIITTLDYGGAGTRPTDRMVNFYVLMKKMFESNEYRVLNATEFKNAGFMHRAFPKADGRMTRVRSDRSYYVVAIESVKEVVHIVRTVKARALYHRLCAFEKLVAAYNVAYDIARDTPGVDHECRQVIDVLRHENKRLHTNMLERTNIILRDETHTGITHRKEFIVKAALDAAAIKYIYNRYIDKDGARSYRPDFLIDCD